MKTTIIDKEKILNTLKSSKCIAFPTETVMGLGVYFDDFNAYNYLNKIKNRPEDKPYTLMVKSVEDIEKYAYISPLAERLITSFMPGAITLLLKSKDLVPTYVTHNTGIIGIRVPDFDIANEVLNIANKPLLVPSANKSGEKPCLTYLEVIDVFKDEVPYVVNENSLKQKPSTIINVCDGKLKMIREGDLTLDYIRRKLKMRIAIGSDHGGFSYKEEIKKHLIEKGYEVIDEGTYSLDSCHYPVFGEKVANDIKNDKADYGVLICTSGEGICIAANKVNGVRCGIGYNDDVSRLMRQHNNANVIAFGQKFMELKDVLRRVDIFLNTEFEGGRHQTRVDLINKIEKEN